MGIDLFARSTKGDGWVQRRAGVIPSTNFALLGAKLFRIRPPSTITLIRPRPADTFSQFLEKVGGYALLARFLLG